MTTSSTTWKVVLNLTGLLAALANLVSGQIGPTPVIFVPGWDDHWLVGYCKPQTDPAKTFGNLPGLLRSNGIQTYLFDNCSQSGQRNLPIETLGQLLGQFIANIPAPQVDIVAHSMGGLITRAYLAGIQPPQNSFQVFAPPANSKIRKIVFIATPHFGAGLANFANFFGTDSQSMEMTMGSSFLWNLARWNQGFDDLRGLESLAIIGSGGGTGAGDGVVAMTSASISSFARADERTRILPYCHENSLALLLACANATPIAQSSETALITQSFLVGTNDWRQIGSTPSNVPALNGVAGMFFAAKDGNDSFFSINSVTYDSVGDYLLSGPSTFYEDFLSPGSYLITAQTTRGSTQGNVNIQGGRFTTYLMKVPPLISAILPSAGVPDALTVAPGSLISLYGFGLASGTAQAAGLPLPVQLADTTVTVGGVPAPLVYAGDRQVNAYLPSNVVGLVNVTVKNLKGQHTTTMFVSPAAPALFSINGSGFGPAAAEHASGSIIGASNPAIAGEYISLFATGLGATVRSGGLDVAVLTPQVYIGGIPAVVTFAGRAPGFVGLDQINFQMPAGVTGGSVPVVAMSNGRTSNAVTIAIQ
jgi:uncharacterized protein (TIGR03437 family)